MKIRIKGNVVENIVKACLFIVLAVVTIHLYPRRDSNFTYNFELGRPWSYDLLTATEDIAIQKTQEQLEMDRKAALKDFAPYYRLDLQEGQHHIAAILSNEKTQELYQEDNDAFVAQLRRFYAKGIISSSDIERWRSEGYNAITILDKNHIATVVPLTQCRTPKMVYSELSAASSKEALSLLQEMNINAHIVPNLKYDSTTTKKWMQSRLDSVSITEGVVIPGEKIIDKGEIVTPRVYQILVSMRDKEKERTLDQRKAKTSEAAQGVLVLIVVSMLVIYLTIFRKDIFARFKNVLFLVMMVMLMVAASCLFHTYTPLSIYYIPIAWVPIIVRVFYDSRTAFVMHVVTILLISFSLLSPLDYLFIQLAVGMVAVSSVKVITKRSQLAHTALFILITYAITYTCYVIAQSGDWALLDWREYVAFTVNALLVIFAYGLIYLCEKAFGLVSSVTLIELNDVNSDLMVDFSEKAPGTFQHSVQVSNLAMEAAKKVGADPLLVRTGALYHDLGKMLHPENFIENQSGGVNPLANLSPLEAAQRIIAHVEDGKRIAEKERLPRLLIDFIVSHHGESKVRYFYNTYCNAHPGDKVDEKAFTYPGPKPSTKETGILMMADAVEARSRSLQEYTEESICQMVDQMIDSQIADGQLKNTPLSFRDVENIKQVFKDKLISMNHHRIVYPELKTKDEPTPAQ